MRHRFRIAEETDDHSARCGQACVVGLDHAAGTRDFRVQPPGRSVRGFGAAGRRTGDTARTREIGPARAGGAKARLR